MEANPRTLAPGFNLLSVTKISQRSIVFYQTQVLLITFFAYAAFHASRKPPSIVKSVLGPEVQLADTEIDRNSSSIDTGWAPFDGRRGPHRLGELDLAFLSAYSIGMYFAGHIGDRIDLRLFLSFGMFGSGISTVVFGLAYWWKIHNLGFFLLVQIVSGLFQSTGWPCVVSVLGNWFGKSKRGLIMGIWSSHASIGNVLGSVVASSVLAFGWGWSFALPGIFLILIGLVVFLFLIVTPEDAGFESLEKDVEMLSDSKAEYVVASEEIKGEEEDLLQSGSPVSLAAIGFLEAWRLPGVAPYAFCLFFSKLVSYTFLYWLPFYIRHTAVAGVHLSHETAGMFSTIFDIGGIFGGISAGYISDRIEARAVTSILFLIFSVPALILYRTYGSISMCSSTGLMFLSGLLVTGPYSLITTAVATDLGTQSLIKGNSRALATVTAIIDGTGSVGAALGPLLTGYISTTGWNSVFLMLIVSILLAILFLIRLARAEINSNLSEGKWFRESMPVR
ncbi:putative glycerol-3-phosphate transporter 5 [Macadamia integrifolia]|uniref:putative glycerol-3-phosphate transporter 5 n=1 Tax=Macadamia integrifolia TaxID=60698 RepID=UPI001C4F3F7B|nr:putative glycerol-3-phosphate transporter 5 [Macadamia integrifolia]